MADIYKDIEAEIPRLRRYARVLVRDLSAADDLVQECLVRALAKLHLWQEGTNLRAWLFTILHNQHVNQIRRQIRAGTSVDLDEAEPFLNRPADQDKCLELRDLERALDRLPEAQRAVILLIGLEGMLYSDVSAVLGIPVGTVRSRISRGRDALRHLMEVEADRPVEHDAAGICVLRREAQYRPGAAGRSPPTRAHRRIAAPALAAAS